MTTTKTTQIKRHISMVIGAIVVMIILFYAYIEITHEQPVEYHLLEIKPLTGRHHQIRVQLSKIGCTIKGDLKYGAKRSNKDGSIHLHAREIELTHPVKKEPLLITAPVPEEPLWKFFENKYIS